MKNVLIFGAGSIGNHMAYACRKLKLTVYITDIDPNALFRMKNSIYPTRYGLWDKNIKIINFKKIYKLNIFFDLIIIGTPPETHYEVYKYCKSNLKYKRVLIEKPIINYSNKNLNNFIKIIKNDLVFCGYNHSISPSFTYFLKNIIKEKKINKIDVKWCESWKGIMNAHYWLKNEFSSYLGNYDKGGGAFQEHSHGLHLLILIIKKILKLKINSFKIKSISLFKKFKNKKYDIFSILAGYKKNVQFNYSTDLNTFPAQKKIIIYGNNKTYEWYCGYNKNYDIVKIKLLNKLLSIKKFKKTRSSEFENELKHILKINNQIDMKKSNLNTKYSFLLISLLKKHFKDEK